MFYHTECSMQAPDLASASCCIEIGDQMSHNTPYAKLLHLYLFTDRHEKSCNVNARAYLMYLVQNRMYWWSLGIQNVKSLPLINKVSY